VHSERIPALQLLSRKPSILASKSFLHKSSKDPLCSTFDLFYWNRKMQVEIGLGGAQLHQHCPWRDNNKQTDSGNYSLLAAGTSHIGRET
jgi:hypothetical protein